MKLHTASEVISFARELEKESSKLYQELSRRYARDENVFTTFASENERNITSIERAYYGVISDAIEGGFAFDIESDDYEFDAMLAQDASYPDTLNKASMIEQKIMQFYSNAARQSDSLIADISRAFRLVARKRDNRREKLKLLLNSR